MSEQKPTAWRLLMTGERINRGDEHLNDDAETWRPVPSYSINMPYAPAVLMPTRRKTQEAASHDD